MDKRIEEMKKNAEPVHERCRGEGFTEEEKPFLTGPFCDRIDPVVQEKERPDFLNPACRCTVYFKPVVKWKDGKRCPMSSHFRPDLETKTAGKTRVGQQKQKKKKG